MAGVSEENYQSNGEGSEVAKESVPTIGGVDGIPATAEVVASEHLTDGPRAEGVDYPETPGVGPYPAPTDVGEAGNPLKP